MCHMPRLGTRADACARSPHSRWDTPLFESSDHAAEFSRNRNVSGAASSASHKAALANPKRAPLPMFGGWIFASGQCSTRYLPVPGSASLLCRRVVALFHLANCVNALVDGALSMPRHLAKQSPASQSICIRALSKIVDQHRLRLKGRPDWNPRALHGFSIRIRAAFEHSPGWPWSALTAITNAAYSEISRFFAWIRLPLSVVLSGARLSQKSLSSSRARNTSAWYRRSSQTAI